MAVLDTVVDRCAGRPAPPRTGTGSRRGDILLTVTGSTQRLLTAERTMLNLLCRASGVATATRAWAEALAGTGTDGPRHPQDDARPAGAGEVRRPLRWRHEQAARPVRRRHDQGQPHRGGRRCGGGLQARYAGCTRTSSSRSKCPLWTWLPNAVRAGATFLLCDNMPPEHLRGGRRHGGAERRAGGDRRPDACPQPASTPKPACTTCRSARSPTLRRSWTSPWICGAPDAAGILMLLCIDVGNTQTVYGIFAGDRLERSWRTKTDARATADELALTVRGLLDGEPVSGLAVCSTVPAVLRELRLDDRRPTTSDLPAVVVGPGVRTGVPLLVDNPKEVGADRVVNSLAAFHLYGGPAIVVDFGTSTSIDVVGRKGEFLGGALAPGIEISVDALAAKAAQLRKVELVRPRSVIGKNTVEALQSGVVFGYAGQVDGLVTRITAELGGEIRP
ncbi:MAG: type III pantothenate kinase [Geodermatophilaceae bacterium]